MVHSSLFQITTLLLSATSFISASPLDVPAIVNSVIHASIVKRGDVSGKELLRTELARIQGKRAGSAPAINEDVSYVVQMTVGNQDFDLIVDTGSSNTWIGADKKYTPSSTSNKTEGQVSVQYGSGSFSGTEYTDKVSLASLTVTQSIGVASSATGFRNVDGILGLGPVGLTDGTVSNETEIPTFLNNLHSAGHISDEVLGVYFTPLHGNNTKEGGGQLTFGGTDPTKYFGTIAYSPLSTQPSFSNYWSISLSNFTYGGKRLNGVSSAIVDTGTTLIYIPNTAYTAFLAASNGTTDQTTGMVAFSKPPTESFTISIGGVPLPLTPAQYLVPQAQYKEFGLAGGIYYAWIGNGGQGGINFIIGQKFLEQYYSVYDTTNQQIGFAPAVRY